MVILLTSLGNGMNFLGNIWAVTCISESQMNAESHVYTTSLEVVRRFVPIRCRHRKHFVPLSRLENSEKWAHEVRTCRWVLQDTSRNAIMIS